MRIEDIDPEFCSSELYKEVQNMLEHHDNAQPYRVRQHWIIKSMFELSKEIQANYEKIARQNELLKELAEKLQGTYFVNELSEDWSSSRWIVRTI